MQTVVETPGYLSDAKAAGLSEDERSTIASFVAANPTAGVLMPETGGARKLRFAGRGKGKSGGYRVVSYFGGVDVPVFLLNIFSKDERANLSRSERNALREVLDELADAYRKGAKRDVQSR